MKMKILVVEDDMPVAMMLTYLLARAGIETEAAATGEKALEMAADGHFDLITLDVDLPDISGFDVCRRLRENPFFQTPVLFCSGRPTEENIQRGLELGAVDFIEKPFGPSDFVSRILAAARNLNKTVKIGAATSDQVMTESGQNII